MLNRRNGPGYRLNANEMIDTAGDPIPSTTAVLSTMVATALLRVHRHKQHSAKGLGPEEELDLVTTKTLQWGVTTMEVRWKAQPIGAHL